MDIIKNNNQEHCEILRKLDKRPEVTQRKLASELGFSLGKLNYCLKELKLKGLIKIKNFKSSKKKISYYYILTPSGIKMKKNLIVNFMEIKMKEYDELKNEINN